jgi:hemerythrin
MEPIVWTEEFSVGVAKLDLQHQKLIRMLNQLIRDPAAMTRSETIAELLTEMVTYAKEHFSFEEILMSQYDYPDSRQHIQEHRQFQKKTAELCSAVMLNVKTVPEVMLSFLLQWLTHHILTVDMAYKSFFQERGLQ